MSHQVGILVQGWLGNIKEANRELEELVEQGKDDAYDAVQRGVHGGTVGENPGG